MPTLFTRIIDREIPGRFIYEDDRCVAFLTIEPMYAGHTLVVPREEYDHWIDLPEDLNAHVWTVAQRVGKAIHAEFSPARIGVLVVGEEVPHVHVHVTGFDAVGQLSFASVRRDVTPDEFDDWQRRLQARLG
jgi:diadenosine tetraphosphate (Ap4A) HIT family hydrolase